MVFFSIIGLGVALYFWHQIKNRKQLIVILLCGTLFVMGLGLEGYAKTVREANVKRYETLVLYQPLVERCTDETVRFDYYERVKQWNIELQREKQVQNSFLALVVPPRFPHRGISEIDFVLNSNTVLDTSLSTP